VYWCDSRPCSKVFRPHFDRVVPLAGVGGVDGSFEASVDLRQRIPDRCVEGYRPDSTQVADRPVAAAAGRERAMVRPALGLDGRTRNGCGRPPGKEAGRSCQCRSAAAFSSGSVRTGRTGFLSRRCAR
jgi:hypothetical protein